MTIYTKENCFKCTALKNIMDNCGIRYDEKHISELKGIRPTTVPVLVEVNEYGDIWYHDYDGAIKYLMDRRNG